jgi:hypothetical protein
MEKTRYFVHLEVWFDSISDDNLFRVSLCDAHDRQIKLLSAHEDKHGAIEAGRKAARKLRLDSQLFFREEDGTINPITRSS